MSAVLRIRSTALVPGEDRLLYYDGAPFSGLAYDVTGDGIVRAVLIIDNGRLTGESDDWLPLAPGGVRVDRAFIEPPATYGPELFGGAPFTGIAYTFLPSGPCIAEVEYEGGMQSERALRRWYEGGEPWSLVRNGESTAWSVDGRVQYRASQGVLLYNVIQRDDGGVAGLVLRDASYFDLSMFRTASFVDEPMLIGNAIDANILRTLRDRTPLGNTTRLRLVETSLGPADVNVIAAFWRLQELWLDGNPEFGPEEARRIEAQRPGCAVRFKEE